MNQDKGFKMGQKKKIPGGFLLFLIAMFLIIMTIHSLSSGKTAKVSFSHQVEHLVNLDLLKPEESRQTAQSETLTTFSSQFRDAESEEGKKRFKYLELLNENHQLASSKSQLSEDLNGLENSIKTSAALFLQLSSISVPSSGYVVVGPTYDTATRHNSIIIDKSSANELISIDQVENDLNAAKKNPTAGNMDVVQSKLLTLVQLFRSPSLGIGIESIKKDLEKIETSISSSETKELLPQQKLQVYQTAIASLQSIISDLNQESNSARLTSLRSVRSYLDGVKQYTALDTQLENNEGLLVRARKNVGDVNWFFNNKEVSTRVLEKQGSEEFSHWFTEAKSEWENFASNKGLAFKAVDQPRTLTLEKTFKSQEQAPNYLSYIFTILPVVIVVLLLYYVFSKQVKGAGSSAMNFGKSPARLMTKEMNKVTFKDVAGAEESKEELLEIVDFLKDPGKFTALGAEIPKGVLLVGPPGTGKTLIAKAVAGEADRPFFSISGSDFVEMFVGVGASRIRDMFDQARKNAPCIIFIDEIDAVGRHRGAGIGGGHDEREQTLNQLLVEMDGFDTREGVILMAATNRPDILDKALLRPGRFDRRVVLDLPDIKGRLEILKVHARKIKIDKSVNLMEVAKGTPGASGADLKNILNEAALLAARKGRTAVTNSEAREACDKVRFGKERRSLEMDENEKKTTAYHESGHAIVGLVVEHSDPVDKVTIIPRGFSLGATHFMPQKNRLSYWKKELIDQLAVTMGGRVAEEIFVHDMSSGAQHDIAQATRLARCMVCEWGMSDLGLVAFDEANQNQYGYSTGSEKNYSDETAKKIDQEVHRLIDEGHKRATQIIEDNKPKVQLMTDMLMEFETLDATDVKEIMDGTWNTDKKKERVQSQDDLRKVPPPPPKEDKLTINDPDAPTPEGV